MRIENIAISCTVLTYQQHSNLMFYHNGTTLPCFKTLSENVDLVNNTSKQIMSKMLTLSLRTRIIKYCDENSKVFCLLCSTICLLALGIKTERHFFFVPTRKMFILDFKKLNQVVFSWFTFEKQILIEVQWHSESSESSSQFIAKAFLCVNSYEMYW